MRTVYLQCKNIPYVYDIDDCKLYQLTKKEWQQVDNQAIISSIRLKGIEVSHADALELIRHHDHDGYDGSEYSN